MRSVFADTFYWIALTNPGDKHAQEALRFDSFLSGLDLYASRPDKAYSLTDCISMQTMRRKGLREVLTNDRHFEQEGFRTLFRI